MNGECLRLYAWNDAPEKYRALSTNRGNEDWVEDWVLVGPRNYDIWDKLYWAGFSERYVHPFGLADWYFCGEEMVAIFSHLEK